MKATIVTLVILMSLLFSSVLIADGNGIRGKNLSLLISQTYPITRKCPPINGERAIQLTEDTPAMVYFKTKGWQTGYLVAGETVYYDPQTLCMTRMVRCGNPAEGRVTLPPCKVKVEYRTETKYCTRDVSRPAPPPCQPPAPIVNNYYTFNSVPMMSYQIGGNQGAIVNSTGIASVGWSQVSRISITNTANGGNAPTNINNTNNNANSNTNVNPNNNVINVGSGSANGNATGTGNSTATSDP